MIANTLTVLLDTELSSELKRLSALYRSGTAAGTIRKLIKTNHIFHTEIKSHCDRIKELEDKLAATKSFLDKAHTHNRDMSKELKKVMRYVSQ